MPLFSKTNTMAKPLFKKTKSGLPTSEVELALTEGAKCGMGIDFKKGFITLPNYNTVSGDIDGYVALYIENGSIEIGAVDDVRATIAGYCNNAAVSATGVTISGCLSGTPIGELETRQLTATVLPLGSVQTGTWTSSNVLAATVSSTGLVTPVIGGDTEATITFTSTDGGFTATCVVTVG